VASSKKPRERATETGGQNVPLEKRGMTSIHASTVVLLTYGKSKGRIGFSMVRVEPYVHRPLGKARRGACDPYAKNTSHISHRKPNAMNL